MHFVNKIVEVAVEQVCACCHGLREPVLPPAQGLPSAELRRHGRGVFSWGNRSSFSLPFAGTGAQRERSCCTIPNRRVGWLLKRSALPSRRVPRWAAGRRAELSATGAAVPLFPGRVILRVFSNRSDSVVL